MCPKCGHLWSFHIAGHCHNLTGPVCECTRKPPKEHKKKGQR